MKIERISDNQIKFVLSHSDLLDRNIKLTELAYGSEKTQELFREMMHQAMEECGFEAENVPLMIEAIPLSADSITIIVTKVTNVEDIEEKFNMLPGMKGADKQRAKDTTIKQAKSKNSDTMSIFSFENLDQVTKLSVRLYGHFNGTNILFKEQNKYFLLLQNDAPEDSVTLDELDAVLGEYGQKHISTVISQYYLAEHGELIIKSAAIKVLAEHLGSL